VRGIGRDHDDRYRGWVITFCVLTAAFLWFIFSLQETYTRILELPMEVADIPDGRALTRLPPERAQVQVVGEGVQLLRYYYNPPRIFLRGHEEGEVDVQSAAREALGNVILQSVSPRTVDIMTGPVEWKRVRVQPRVELQLKAGHRIIPPVRIRPDSVTLVGARSILEGIRSWPTERRTLGGVDDSVSTMIPLRDSLAGLVEFDTREVAYFANVQEFTQAVRMVDVRVTGMPDGRQVSLDPSRVELTYQIPLSQFDAAQESDDLYLEVPWAAMRDDDSGMIFPTLRTPPYLYVLQPRWSPSGLRYYDVLEGEDQ